MGGLGGTVAIIGTGTIKFGENFHQRLSDMIFEAVNLALADARIESRQLQAGWLGCYEPMLYGFEGNSGTVVSDPLNLFPIPVTRVAAYCATGIEAVRNAALTVASGEYDLVLAVGGQEDARGAFSRLARRASREPGASRAGQGPDCRRHVRARRDALLQGVRGAGGGARGGGDEEPLPRLPQAQSVSPASVAVTTSMNPFSSVR